MKISVLKKAFVSLLLLIFAIFFLYCMAVQVEFWYYVWVMWEPLETGCYDLTREPIRYQKCVDNYYKRHADDPWGTWAT